jgi:exonuclease VII small subunit
MNNNLHKEIEELNKIIDWFDSSDFDIVGAIDKFKEAEKLADKISDDLKNLKNEVTVIKKNFDTK